MAVTAKAYGPLILSAFGGEIDYLNDTVKAMLTTSSYVPNQDTHRYLSDVTNEVTGTGYTAGGWTLTNKDLTYDNATNTATFASDDPSWAALTVTGIRILVFYVDTGVAATSPLISYMDFGADQSPSAQPFVVPLPATGLLSGTVT